MSVKAFLVTGGSGFIGHRLCYYLAKKYPDYLLINYSRHTYAVDPNLVEKTVESCPNYRFVAGDINNKILLLETLRKNNVKRIFHLAASSHVDRSFIYPEEFLRANVEGTFNILEVLRYMKRKPLLIYMSTDEVFGDVPTGYCVEGDLFAPRNPYSVSKASAEIYCNAYHHSFNIPVITVRSMNNFGEGQHPEKLIGKIISKCLTDTPFTLYKGGSIRGWIYIGDTADALDTVANKGKIGEVYHIPPAEYLTVPQVAQRILKIMGREHLFKGYKGRRLKDDERYALSGTKMTYDLGWRPRVTFDEGIKKVIKWYKENEWFWRGHI